MEHVLYASLLEDTPTDLADEGFAKCEQDFFDWNEVRVTTVTELAEVLSRLPSATSASVRLKRNLQSMFEAFYNFDLDYLKKENLGKATAKFEAMPGMSPFVLSYLIQHGLGGHAIPVDRSSMKIIWLCGIVSDTEAESGRVPGLERTVAKNKSIEFSSLLHQAGVALQQNPQDKMVWEVLTSVNKDAKALFDKGDVPSPSTSKPKKAAAPVVAPPTPAKAGKASPGKKTAVALDASKSEGVKPKVLKEKPTPGSGVKAKSAKASGDPNKAAAAPSKSPSASKTKASPDTEGQKPSTKNPLSAKIIAAKIPAAKAVDKSKTTPQADAKKTTSSKDAVAKPTAKPGSSKSPAAVKSTTQKPESKKTDTSKSATPKTDKKSEKPASKKTSGPAVGSTAPSASTNKKLTKQKPR